MRPSNHIFISIYCAYIPLHIPTQIGALPWRHPPFGSRIRGSGKPRPDLDSANRLLVPDRLHVPLPRVRWMPLPHRACFSVVLPSGASRRTGEETCRGAFGESSPGRWGPTNPGSSTPDLQPRSTGSAPGHETHHHRTNVFFNAVNWVESSAWDDRDAVVVAGDVALAN